MRYINFRFDDNIIGYAHILLNFKRYGKIIKKPYNTNAVDCVTSNAYVASNGYL